MSFETGSICLKFFEQYVDCFLKGKNAYLEFGEASKEQKLHWQGKKEGERDCVDAANSLEWMLSEQASIPPRTVAVLNSRHNNSITHQLNGWFIYTFLYQTKHFHCYCSNWRHFLFSPHWYFCYWFRGRMWQNIHRKSEKKRTCAKNSHNKYTIPYSFLFGTGGVLFSDIRFT